MGSAFHDLLCALEAEHERQLAECHRAALHDVDSDFERPNVRQTKAAAINLCAERCELSNTPLSESDGVTDPASKRSENFSETMVEQKLEVSGAVVALESQSPLTPMRRSSGSQHTGHFEDPRKERLAEKVLLVTSFLDGPGGVAYYKTPLSSSSPSQIGWCCLWAFYGTHGIYHVIRVLALMFSSTLDRDNLMAGMLFCTCYVMYCVVPFRVCQGKFISRCRAFAAAMSTILSEARAAYFLDDLQKVVRFMHVRRLIMFVVLWSVELMLLFGPSRAPYRRIALWPWAQTDEMAVLHAVVSSINCTVMFMSDVDHIMLTTIKHTALSLRNNLENSPVKAVHQEYDFLCDYLEDYFDVEASTLKYPFTCFCFSALILGAASVSKPDSHYLPYFLYITILFVAVFLKDMFTFADQNASIAALADAVFKRSFYGLPTEDSIEDLHLRLCVTHRRPALVVFGVLEITRPGLVGLMSFLLSLAFVIIFEMRT